MKATPTDFHGLYILEPKLHSDSRGYFFESFNSRALSSLIEVNYSFIQDNQSLSMRGTIRGLHFQKGEFAQAKLVRVLSGEIKDVVIDLRCGSPTYGKSYSVTLSSSNNKQLLIPRGFAHGFSVLSEKAEVLYKCDNVYSPKSESGIYCFDRDLSIDWGVEEGSAIISTKDKNLPSLSKVLKLHAL